MTTHNGVARVAVHYADGRTTLHPDATDALAETLGIPRHRLGNLLMGALGDTDELAAGLAGRYSLPLEPVEQALAVLEALAERALALNVARLAWLAEVEAGNKNTAVNQVGEPAERYRILANRLETLAKEVIQAT